MKKKDEAALPPTGDENCVSGLIGNVITLIISILMWLQKVDCNNFANSKSCPNTCQLTDALQKLNDFAKQADEIGASVSHSKSAISSSARESKKTSEAKLSKRSRSQGQKTQKPDGSYAVLYAVSQDDVDDDAFKKYSRKVVEPAEKRGDVIYEVIETELVPIDTQTSFVKLQDVFTEVDDTVMKDVEISAMTSCVCVAVQKSEADLYDQKNQSDISAADKAIQGEFAPTARSYPVNDEEEVLAADADDEQEEEDTEEEEESEDYNDYDACPPRCPSYAQGRQMPSYAPQQMPYPRGQYSVRQQRSPMYYDPTMYKQSPAAYPRSDPYAQMGYNNYPPQPQPYYHKITRTIQRGPAPGSPRPVTPTQRPKQVSQECQQDCTGIENYSQSESPPPTPPPPPPPPISARSMPPAQTKPSTPQSAKGECVPECPVFKRVQPVQDKTCMPDCKGVNVIKPQVKVMARSLPVPEPKEPEKEPVKKCTAKCSKVGKGNSPESKSSTPSQSVSFMPKGAIAIDPSDVQALEVEEAPPNKPLPGVDSYLSVEKSKQKK